MCVGSPDWHKWEGHRALEKVEHWLVLAVFIGMGLFLIESGVVPRRIEILT